MGFLRGVLIAVISSVIFLMLMSFGISLGMNQLLYPQVYENALEKGGAYDFIDGQAGGFKSESGSINFVIMGAGGIRGQINELIEKSLEYIRGDSGRFELYWDINKTEIKEFFRKEAAKIRVCSSKEIDNYYAGEVDCRPSGMTVDDFLNKELKERNVTILNDNESRINVLDIYDKERNIEKAREIVMWYEVLRYILVLLIALFMALVILISKNKLRGGLKKIGATLVLAGIWLFIIAKISGSFLFSNIISKMMVIPAIGKSADAIISPVVNSIGNYGLIFLVIGIASFIASFFFMKHDDARDMEVKDIDKKDKEIELKDEEGKKSEEIAESYKEKKKPYKIKKSRIIK